MITRLAHVTVIVRDQDEALRFYTEKLGLEKRADMAFADGGMRWLTVAPQGQTEVEIVLFTPGSWQDEEATKALLGRVGQGTTWVFNADDCQKEYETLSARGVKFVSPPQERPYGIEALFEDLYGNGFSLLEPRT